MTATHDLPKSSAWPFSAGSRKDVQLGKIYDQHRLSAFLVYHLDHVVECCILHVVGGGVASVQTHFLHVGGVVCCQRNLQWHPGSGVQSTADGSIAERGSGTLPLYRRVLSPRLRECTRAATAHLSCAKAAYRGSAEGTHAAFATHQAECYLLGMSSAATTQNTPTASLHATAPYTRMFATTVAPTTVRRC